jgi:serine/threonine protein kinase
MSMPMSGEPGPVAVADALLATALQPAVLAILVEPSPLGHTVTVETGGAVTPGLFLDSDVGDAAIARVALVAGLDVVLPTQQIGRVSLRLDSAAAAKSAEVYVMVMRVAQGLSAEIRRVIRAGTGGPLAAAEGSRGGASSGDLLGPYRLLGRIGYGGMGEVFEAEHQALGRKLAVKILRVEAVRSSVVAASLLSEGRLAARARNPGIVDVTDYGLTPDGRPYLVMELVEWPTLDRVLRNGLLSAQRAVVIARQMLDALDAAHHQGVVHRDLKPENVFVGPRDQVKIGDFGIAKLIEAPEDRHEKPRTVAGSPPYMSPEHARGLPTDGRTDIYAVGCILFEMLSGRCPYQGTSSTEVLVKHVHEEIPDPVSPAGALPRELVNTVRKALAKDRTGRYQNAREMIVDLDESNRALQRKGWRQWLNNP